MQVSQPPRPPLPVDVVDSFWAIWGTVADWVAGVGTVGALVWGMIIFGRQLSDARRAQAARVIVSILSEQLDDESASRLQGYVENHSDLPIFYVQIRFDGRGPYEGIAERIDGGKHFPFDSPQYADTEAEAVFTDAAGHVWKRDTNGKLRSDEKPLRSMWYAARRRWWSVSRRKLTRE